MINACSEKGTFTTSSGKCGSSSPCIATSPCARAYEGQKAKHNTLSDIPYQMTLKVPPAGHRLSWSSEVNGSTAAMKRFTWIMMVQRKVTTASKYCKHYAWQQKCGCSIITVTLKSSLV